ncbi:MAG: hypothetical protein Q4E12_03460 [Coriobacteriia bacterium]|nr:hypothetical protein [Coriobacteriia bacterium]
MLKELAKTCHSYRRFYQDQPIGADVLKDLVDTTRYAAATRNDQARLGRHSAVGGTLRAV